MFVLNLNILEVMICSGLMKLISFAREKNGSYCTAYIS